MRLPFMNTLAARPPSRRVLDRPAFALMAAFVLAVAAPAYAHHTVTASRQSTPQAAVRGFLTAVVDRDGNTACQYLTVRARTSFEGHGASRTSCEISFSGANVTLGGLDLESRHDLDGLTYRGVPMGAERRVDVSHDGQTISFKLRIGTPPELNEFHAPDSPWRIDSSVADLAPSPSPAHIRL